MKVYHKLIVLPIQMDYQDGSQLKREKVVVYVYNVQKLWFQFKILKLVNAHN